uniref:lysozyme n=1 Tax=Macrostomum lignano TaxID=282301 RepID=A0A1I8F870_9PLAT
MQGVLLITALLACCFCQQIRTRPTDLPDKFFRCICKIESNCNPSIGCVNDPVTLSCGPYQIKEAYWQDASELPGEHIGGRLEDLYHRSDNMSCSKKVMLNYFQRYGRYCTGTTPESTTEVRPPRLQTLQHGWLLGQSVPLPG